MGNCHQSANRMSKKPPACRICDGSVCDMDVHKQYADVARESCSKGNTAFRQGDFKTALEQYLECSKATNILGDIVGEARAHGNLGNVYYSLGDFRQALAHYALWVKVTTPDLSENGRAHGNIANVYLTLGDYVQALKHHKLQLQFARRTKDRVGEGRAHGGLGSVCNALGDYNKAFSHHNDCLAIAMETNDRAGEGRAHSNLGVSYESIGAFEKSLLHHEIDLAIALELGDKSSEGTACCNMGDVYIRLGQGLRAAQYYRRYLELSSVAGDHVGQARAYRSLSKAMQLAKHGNCPKDDVITSPFVQQLEPLAEPQLVMYTSPERLRLATEYGELADQAASRCTNTCSVCLDDFGCSQKQMNIVRLACTHIFHFDCLHRWVCVNNRCPECREEIDVEHLHKPPVRHHISPPTTDAVVISAATA